MASAARRFGVTRLPRKHHADLRQVLAKLAGWAFALFVIVFCIYVWMRQSFVG